MYIFVTKKCSRDQYLDTEMKICIMFPMGKYQPDKCRLIVLSYVCVCVTENCSSGSYLDTEMNECTLCPLRAYQPDKWQTKCLECQGQRTTDAEGATSVDECRR